MKRLIHFGNSSPDIEIIYNSMSVEKIEIPLKWWGNEGSWYDKEYLEQYLEIFKDVDICVDKRPDIYFKHSFYKSIVDYFDDVKCIFPLRGKKEFLFNCWKSSHESSSSSKNETLIREYYMGEFINYIFRDIFLIKRVIKRIGFENILFINMYEKDSKDKISKFSGVALKDFKIENMIAKISKDDLRILKEFEEGFKKNRETVNKFYEIFKIYMRI